MSILDSIFNFIMPRKCSFCGKITSGEDICSECMAQLPWRERTSVDIDYADSCWAPLWYEGNAAAAIKRFKFSGAQQLDECLGRLMYECIAASPSSGFDVVTWVPVNFVRRQKRRYDQAYLLAKTVARHMGVKCRRMLVKQHNILPQYKMSGSAQRKANVSGAYRLCSGTNPEGLRILLIDDIVTTGSTLNECSRLLLTAGAQSVVCLCIAKAGRE
jgi:ComF family protein